MGTDSPENLSGHVVDRAIGEIARRVANLGVELNGILEAADHRDKVPPRREPTRNADEQIENPIKGWRWESR